jgi:hypothetical protein
MARFFFPSPFCANFFFEILEVFKFITKYCSLRVCVFFFFFFSFFFFFLVYFFSVRG